MNLISMAERIKLVLDQVEAFTLMITFDRIEWHEAWLYAVGSDHLYVAWQEEASIEDRELLPVSIIQGIRVSY